MSRIVSLPTSLTRRSRVRGLSFGLLRLVSVAAPLNAVVRALVKSIELGAALVLPRRAAFLGLFWRFGLVVLAKLAVLGCNRSVRFRHAAV